MDEDVVVAFPGDSVAEKPKSDDEKSEKSNTAPMQKCSSLDEVKAMIAKKHGGQGAGSQDPIWMLHTMFEVFVSDISNLLADAELSQAGERYKLKELVQRSAEILAEEMQSELFSLGEALKDVQSKVETVSTDGLLKQQARFSVELNEFTSKIKRNLLPIYLLTALNWLAVGALYLIMK